jgi:hypothetical protein
MFPVGASSCTAGRGGAGGSAGNSVDEEEYGHVNPSLSAERVGDDGETIMDGSDQTEPLSSSAIGDRWLTGDGCTAVGSMVSWVASRTC